MSFAPVAIIAAFSLALATAPATASSDPPTPTAGSECVLPGVTVDTDPTGDENPPVSATQDIESVSIAELPEDPDNTLTITMKVANLASLPPEATWAIEIGTHYSLVYMETDARSVPSYKYGVWEMKVGLPTVAIVRPFGNAVSGTWSADGYISIKVLTSMIGWPSPGDTLTDIRSWTALGSGTDSSIETFGQAIDSSQPDADKAGYQLKGNDYCRNHLPTATLTADPTSDLTVSFTVTGNDPEGKLNGYTLDFGDGETEQGSFDGATSLETSHTYEQAGSYTATLIVTDDHATSAPSTVDVIASDPATASDAPSATTTPPATNATAATPAPPATTRGGALPSLTLGLLALAGGLRRRRFLRSGSSRRRVIRTDENHRGGLLRPTPRRRETFPEFVGQAAFPKMTPG